MFCTTMTSHDVYRNGCITRSHVAPVQDEEKKLTVNKVRSTDKITPRTLEEK